jgi:hypothetical protein
VRCSCIIAILAIALLRASASTNEIPFEFRHGLLWIKASVPQSAEPLNLLVDTGAGASVLDAAVAGRLKLGFGSPVNVRGVETTLTGHWLKPVSATANGVPLPAKYVAVDLHELSKSCVLPVDGLLGADFFRGKVVQIDFAAQKLRLLTRAPEHRNADCIALQFRPCGMRIAVSVNGPNERWVRLDTGCASALQWVSSGVRAEDCMRKPAIGLTELSVPQTQTVVRIGSHEFREVPTGLHAKPIFQGEAGLLGNGLLSRFSSITIDAKSGRLLLEPKP